MPKSRKTQAVEPELLLPVPIQAAKPDLNALLTRAVEQKVAEVMARQQDLIFQPWFQSKQVSAAIRKLQTVPEQRKWTLYYEKWGCIRCDAKQPKHESLGMCHNCYDRVNKRLEYILRKHAPESQNVPFVTDPEKQARKALTEPSPQPAECTGEMGFIDRVAQAQHALRKPRKALPQHERPKLPGEVKGGADDQR